MAQMAPTVLLGLFLCKNMAKTKNTILSRKEAAFDYLSTKREQWDKYENLFHNKLDDSISAQQKSQVFDPKLSTLLLERAYRVMAQLHTGKARAISKNDEGAEQLMNLTLDKYVIPNANSQFDFLTKLRMVDVYSNIYGNFFTLSDWNVNGRNGYVGPDLWLLNIRDVFPQVGAMSLDDSDYIVVRTWKPLSFFKGLKKDKNFTNISKIITKLEDKSGSKQSRDADAESKREENEFPRADTAENSGYFEVLTMYERDKWTDYVVDADEIFREMDNPHDNDDLPVDCKYSIPLIDDFMGMGDMERGAPMQQTINSIWNLYLDAVKMSIFPPALINKDNIAAMSSIKWSAAAKWLVRGNNMANTVQPLNLSPQGIAQFNNTYNVAGASLLNLFGTTDTTVTSETEAGFGKTPQALKMQNARENTRDNADRFFMDQYVQRVMKRMANMIIKNNTEAIQIRMFEPEIESLARQYPDIEEMYDEQSGKLTIDKKTMGDAVFDYEIVSGSSYAVDEESQQQNLSTMLELLLKSPQLVQAVQNDGYKINFGEMFKRLISKTGVQDWEKLVEELKPEEQADQILERDMQNFMQMVQGGGQIGQIPPQQGGQPGQNIGA